MTVNENETPVKKNGKWKQIAAGCLSMVLAGSLTVGGILAYQTASDRATNTFLIGNVKIKAMEPNFPTEDDPDKGKVDGVPDECELLIPYTEIPKDPRIQNTGFNDCVVFFRVTNPVEELNITDPDGTRREGVLEDLFWFKLDSDSKDTHANHFNSSWIKLDSVDGEIVTGVKAAPVDKAENEFINDEGRGKTYIFGYQTAIEPGEITDTLFDKVQNKRYGSRTIGPNEIEQIKVESFAIQKDEIMRAGIEVNTDGRISKDDLTYIYKVFVNQNEGTVGKGAWKK